MQAQVITCHDPFRPSLNREVKIVTRKRRIDKLAPKTDKPFICVLNGEPLLRHKKGWHKSVKDGDTVAFVMLPQGGGGGSNPLKIILAITVAVIAPQIGGMLAQQFAGAGILTGGFGSTLAFGQFLGAVVGFGLNAVINALIPQPSPPKAQKVAELAAPSPTYSLGAQGNTARLGQPIPVVYGRNVIYPDFIGQPYTEYAGNEQYLYQLFSIGQGEFDIEQIRIEDSVVEDNVNQTGAFVTANGSFEEIQYQIVHNATVTAFPAQVYTAVEVSGQELVYETPTASYIGPFVANPAGSLVNQIAVDVVAPKGVYFANDAGGLDTRTVAFKAEARQIDDSGTAIGDWFTIVDTSFSEKTTTPQRRSYNAGVTNGRYEVRMTRTNAKDTNVRAGNDINWATLRGYSRGNQNYGDVTVMAMRIRATNSLSQQASRKFNVIATRKLPTWNGTEWSEPVPTRSIAWAIADLCKAQYGMKLTDAQIDLAGLLDLDATWTSRLDLFDGVFDSQQSAWDALQQIARCGRAVPYIQGGIVSVARDSLETIPTAMFSQRNIVRNSMNLQYIMPSEETADALEMEYWDNGTWQPKTVRAALPDSTERVVSNVKLFGCTQRAQAWREGMYMAACNRYRRRTMNFETDMEGFIPSLGDLIAVQHDMPQWGVSGELTSWDEETLTAGLSEPVDFGAGNHYMSLRRRNGTVSGPYLVSETSDPFTVVFNEVPDIVPDVGIDRERTHFAFGLADSQYIRARVLSIKPRSLNKVAIYAVVESDFVHNADTGAIPADDAWQLPTLITVPVVLGLIGRSDYNDVDKMFLSWQPAAGAEYYLIEVSDSGEGWTRIGETRTSNYTAIAPYGNRTQVRVAGVGVTKGPWVEINYGSSASYMWDADPDTLMWDADDTILMWRY
jgi:hypothetical protein